MGNFATRYWYVFSCGHLVPRHMGRVYDCLCHKRRQDLSVGKQYWFRAAVLSNAPTSTTAIVVTDERFIFALGRWRTIVSNGATREQQYLDRSCNNQAGGQNLTTDGSLISGHSLRGETLLLTTTDAHVARYSGPPFVYSFQRVGDGCGTVSANGCVAADQFAVWPGLNSFHI